MSYLAAYGLPGRSLGARTGPLRRPPHRVGTTPDRPPGTPRTGERGRADDRFVAHGGDVPAAEAAEHVFEAVRLARARPRRARALRGLGFVGELDRDLREA